MTCIKLDTACLLSFAQNAGTILLNFCSFFSSRKNTDLRFCEMGDSRGGIKITVFWYETPCRLTGTKV